MDLYALLPAGIRYQDRLASGVVGLDTEETTLQKILYAVEQEADTQEELTEGLRDLLDADNCREEFLPLLSRFLGVSFFSSWPEGRQRLFVKSLVKLYHDSGQMLSWRALLNMIGYDGATPWELWKQEIYEDFDYCRYGADEGDYYCQYHAARIDVDSKTGSRLNETLTDDERALLDNFRPIHVLIRGYGLMVGTETTSLNNMDSDVASGTAALELSEDMASASDTCLVICETRCEAICEAGTCEGTFEISTTCVATCELGCETGCELSCEVGTEAGTVSMMDPVTGDPIIVTIVGGWAYNQAATAKYSGIVQGMDPATGDPLVLYISTGQFMVPAGFPPYTGAMVVTSYATGVPVTLNIVTGRVV